MIVYYSSASRNTEGFVSRLGLPSCRVEEYNSGKYILITPTYADHAGRHAVPKPVIRFLNAHRSGILGVIGMGNRNFGANFTIGGRVVSIKTGAPYLHSVELRGTETDVKIVRELYADCVFKGQLPALPDGEALA